jgi:hypothetical protein
MQIFDSQVVCDLLIIFSLLFTKNATDIDGGSLHTDVEGKVSGNYLTRRASERP